MKASNQLTITNVIDGKDSVSIILTDENHTFSANSSGQAAAASITTGIQAYKGTSKIATTVGSITGLPAGMTMTVNNNNSASTSISVNVTASLTALSGTVNIPITADGISFTKIFSFTLSKAGATGNTGAAAKSVDITATSQIFKSTDGGATFSPDTIKLTPIFQGGISFSKWQYSTNGGTTWTDVTSGSNGLTISSGVLTIAKTCSLFTESVTSLSFKCISNNATYFDVMTVLKLYDVTDIQIGGRNLLLHSGKKITSSTYLMKSYSTSELKPNTKYTMVLKGSIASPNRFGVWFNGGNSHGAYFPYNQTDTAEYITVTTPTALTATTVNVYNYPSTTASESTIEWAAMYEGEILPPLDWTPAPEDIEEQFTAVTDTVKTAQSKIDAVEGKITNKVWRSDVITIQDSEGNIREKTLVDHLVQNMIDSNGITNTVKDIKTDLGNPNDPSSGTSIYSKITKAQQTADKFTWLVKSGDSSSSITLTDSFLSILARDINIDGKVTFNSFDSATKTQLQTAVNKVDDWSYDSTSIDGGKIYTGTITADKIASNSITSDKITSNSITAEKIVTGAITSDKIAAGSITSDKIMIGDFSNYATVNSNFPETMLPSSHMLGPTVIENGFITKSTSGGYLGLCDATVSTLIQGEQIRYFFYANTDGGYVPIKVSLLCYSDIVRNAYTGVVTSGTLVAEYLSIPQCGNTSGALNSTYPVNCSGVIEINNSEISNAKYFLLAIKNLSAQLLPIYIGNPKFYRKINASLIIDGKIQSANFQEDVQGISIDLDTGVIKGDIKASSMTSQSTYSIYNGVAEHPILKASPIGSGALWELDISPNLDIKEAYIKITNTTIAEDTAGLTGVSIYGRSINLGNNDKSTDIWLNGNVYLDDAKVVSTVCGNGKNGAWNTPLYGTITQTLGTGPDQTSAIVGRHPDGTRCYGIDMLDVPSSSTSNKVMRLYAGDQYLEVRSGSASKISTSYDLDVGRDLTVSKGWAYLKRMCLSQNSSNFIKYGGNGIGWNDGGCDFEIRSSWGIGFGRSDNKIVFESNTGKAWYTGAVAAPSWNTTSLAAIKTNIGLYKQKASVVIQDSSVYHYNLKSELENGESVEHIGFVIGDNYKLNKTILAGDEKSIDMYSSIGVLWKGEQEIFDELKKLRADVKSLQDKLKEE